MIDPIEGTFFKYRTLNEFGKRMLSHREIYFSRPSRLNDPFDCYPHVSLSASAEERRNLANQLALASDASACSRRDFRRHVSLLTERLKDASYRGERLYAVIDAKTGIMSLSKSHVSVLQWSMYADSHRGFCVAFRCGKDTDLGPTFEVEYTDERPQIELTRLLGLQEPEIDSHTLFELSVLRKSRAWRHECEVRAFSLSEQAKAVDARCMTGVYLGARMTEKEQNTVRELMDLGGIAHIPLYRMITDYRTYGVGPTRVR